MRSDMVRCALMRSDAVISHIPDRPRLPIGAYRNPSYQSVIVESSTVQSCNIFELIAVKEYRDLDIQVHSYTNSYSSCIASAAIIGLLYRFRHKARYWSKIAFYIPLMQCPSASVHLSVTFVFSVETSNHIL